MQKCPVCGTIEEKESQYYCLVCAWEFEYYFDELSDDEKESYKKRLAIRKNKIISKFKKLDSIEVRSERDWFKSENIRLIEKNKILNHLNIQFAQENTFFKDKILSYTKIIESLKEDFKKLKKKNIQFAQENTFFKDEILSYTKIIEFLKEDFKKLKKKNIELKDYIKKVNEQKTIKIESEKSKKINIDEIIGNSLIFSMLIAIAFVPLILSNSLEYIVSLLKYISSPNTFLKWTKIILYLPSIGVLLFTTWVVYEEKHEIYKLIIFILLSFSIFYSYRLYLIF